MTPEQEYDAYPVREGEVWECGQHRFRCGDLRDFVAPAHTLIYSDPPWGTGPLNGFHRGAGKAPPTEYRWDDIYEAILRIATGVTPVWLESGRAQAKRLAELMPQATVIEIVYQRKHPALLHYLGPGPPPGALRGVLTGMDDALSPAAVLRAYPVGTVLDPCAGRGCTAICAHFSGWASENNELDPKRVSAALARMHQASGHEVRRIG